MSRTINRGTEDNEDGFRLVKSKRSSKRKLIQLPDQHISAVTVDFDIDVEKCKEKVLLAKEDLLQSEYYNKFIEAVSRCLGARRVVEIISFGLGHIAECSIARYQLALLLCLKDYLSIEVQVHDPIFYTKECDLLHNLNVKVITENKEGKYEISPEELTVAFLPHCPKQLTNNFLWSNWGKQLKHCILICNSFTRLIDTNPNRIIAEEVPFIFNIFPYTEEINLANTFKFTDIFNDLSIHLFHESKLNDLPLEFWSKGESPVYKDTTEFITALVVDKLKL